MIDFQDMQAEGETNQPEAGSVRETDQEEHDRKQAELQAERDEHARRTAGGDPVV